MSNEIKSVSDVSAEGRVGTTSKNNPDGKPTPTVLEFALVFNDSSSRKEVVERFEKLGFHLSYGSLIQREKSYKDPNRKGGAIQLKDMGRSRSPVSADEVNAILAAANAPETPETPEGAATAEQQTA